MVAGAALEAGVCAKADNDNIAAASAANPVIFIWNLRSGAGYAARRGSRDGCAMKGRADSKGMLAPTSRPQRHDAILIQESRSSGTARVGEEVERLFRVRKGREGKQGQASAWGRR
ncbi:MAG: hypothetical protein AMXMBFR25_17720 [Lysobacterales bacterium]